MQHVKTSRLGAALVTATLLTLAALSWMLAGWTGAAWGELARSPAVRVDAVLGLVAAGAATATAVWLLTTTAWCLVSVLRGLEPPTLTPLALRRVLILVLGVGLAATATPGHAGTTPAAPPTTFGQLAPGWQPTGPGPGPSLQDPAPPPAPDRGGPPGDRTGTPWVPQPPPAPAPRPTPEAPASGEDDSGTGNTVLVHPGDTLWEIAARDLGPGATNAQIARAWPAWHARNLQAIGADPNRILPGQGLHRPA